MLLTLQILILLLVVIAAVAVIARRIHIPPAILLVLAGVVLAFIPGLPTIQLAPQLVLLVVLPPVVYWSAVTMSWREFRLNLRPISLLAVGCVVFTTIAVASAAHWFLNFPWAVGFVLGAIVSPPDEVAPLAIARRMRLPSRILVILEGEGLANDATSLVLYRFAIGAVSAGTFSLGQASVQFTAIIIGETLWGIGVGWVMLRLRQRAHDPHIEILLSVITPFIAFWPPVQLGGSGVLAAVAAGLHVSWNGPYLISAATRLQGVFFWDFFNYVIEGLVFLITGLQTRSIIAKMESSSMAELAFASAIICGVMIFARFVWVFPAVYLPRFLIPSVRRTDPSPTWQTPFVLAFTGIRGLVSLAVALAIPTTTDSGQPFPHRDLVLLLTYSVILVTLVGQGLTLPYVIRWLGIGNAGRHENRREKTQEFTARRKAIDAAIARLTQLGKDRELPNEILLRFRAQFQDRLNQIEHRGTPDDGRRRLTGLHDEVEYLMICAERETINELYRENRLSDESRRRLEHELDLRDAHLTKLRESDSLAMD